jgi:beta-lactamase regulating signal transducer with metallopeptidase domain
MLGEIFYWVLNMSITASVMGVIVLLLRKIRKLPPFVPYLLWVVPFIRLWVPFGLASEYSLVNLISKLTTRTVPIYGNAGSLIELTTTNYIMAADDYFPIAYKSSQLEAVFSVASVVWMVIGTAILITSIVIYFITKSEIRSARHYRDNIYLSDKVSSPAVYGIFKPRIVLPADIAQDDLEYILLHENTHIRRGDNIWRLIAIVTACIHWFDPLVWIFLKYFLTDMELSCDHRVLSKSGPEKQKEYASVLLNCAEGKTVFVSSFKGAKVKVRIENILSYKKLTAFSGICFAALITIIAIILLTNAAV